MSVLAKRGLGRGLASLIPDSALDPTPFPERAANRNALRIVPIAEIRANPEQPRRVFDPIELGSLADSVRLHGVLAPLICRRDDGFYVLIAGERRLRAAALAGLTEVPVIVRDAHDAGAQLELALVENLQRVDLDPVESARGYARLAETYGYTQDEIAARVGKDRSTIANTMRLLKLPDSVLDELRAGRITAGHARAMLPVLDPDALRRLTARIVAEQLSVRHVERIVASLVRADGAPPKPEAPVKRFDYASRALSDALHAKVAIQPRQDGGGRIVIDYGSVDELDRLVRQLRGEPVK